MEKDAKSIWFEFFASEKEKLVRYARSRIRPFGDMDAEDIVGDVMMRLVSRPNSSGPIENIAAYAYRAVRNRITDYQKSRSNTVSLDDCLREDGELPLLGALSAPAEDPYGRDERRERLLQLSEAIGRLEPRQRAVLIATELKGKTFRELAETWHEPIGTLLSRKSRAMHNLRRILSDPNEQITNDHKKGD
jgi:RNA polymerase sigma factor (sigma-70 family)